jgi:hypothetical protein
LSAAVGAGENGRIFCNHKTIFILTLPCTVKSGMFQDSQSVSVARRIYPLLFRLDTTGKR